MVEKINLPKRTDSIPPQGYLGGAQIPMDIKEKKNSPSMSEMPEASKPSCSEGVSANETHSKFAQNTDIWRQGFMGSLLQ